METWTQPSPRSARTAPGPAAVFAAARQSQSVADILAPYIKDAKRQRSAGAPVAYPDGDHGEANGSRTCATLRGCCRCRSASAWSPSTPPATSTPTTTRRRRSCGTRAALRRLSAFQADLEARGIADRVLTLVWTEFGRRPKENSSGGTDHGAGGMAWVRARAWRLLTDYPDLNAFDADDNLAVTIDFRAVYSSLLEQWLGTGADEVLPDAGRVGRVALVA